jgi:hypothetical protein
MTVDDPNISLRLAFDGVGLVFMVEQHVAPEIEPGRLELVLADGRPEYEPSFRYMPSRRVVPSPLRAFIDSAKRSPADRSGSTTAGARGEGGRWAPCVSGRWELHAHDRAAARSA